MDFSSTPIKRKRRSSLRRAENPKRLKQSVSTDHPAKELEDFLLPPINYMESVYWKFVQQQKVIKRENPTLSELDSIHKTFDELEDDMKKLCSRHDDLGPYHGPYSRNLDLLLGVKWYVVNHHKLLTTIAKRKNFYLNNISPMWLWSLFIDDQQNPRVAFHFDVR